MRSSNGFTLIEVILLIVVMGLLSSTILLALSAAAKSTPSVLNNTIATQTANKCMEWYIGQRQANGYSSITCPDTTVPAFCTSPSGYTVSTNITCTSINSDNNYKTIVVNVSGSGSASMTTLIASY